MKLAIVGVTGLVGAELIDLLEADYLPGCDAIAPIASDESVGREIECFGRNWPCKPLALESFEGVDIASFSVGDELSAKWIPKLLSEYPQIRIVDKSNAFRLSEDVPLVVCGVNDDEIKQSDRLAANPNCTTIQLALAVKPLFDAFGIERIIASTYQAISGAGRDAISSLKEELDIFYPTYDTSELRASGSAHNVLPQIGSLDNNGFAGEERKIMLELPKILGLQNLDVCVTAARIDAFVGHSISVFVRLCETAKFNAVEDVLRAGYAIDYLPNDPEVYPTPVSASRPDYDLVQVGRLRPVDVEGREYSFFCCANNLRIGAALNALRIAARINELASGKDAGD